MSISAVIIGSDVLVGGEVSLELGPYKGDGPGQKQLIVVNPPENVEAFQHAVLGQQIWGSNNTIMVRNTTWAYREGYTRIWLAGTPILNSQANNYDD